MTAPDGRLARSRRVRMEFVARANPTLMCLHSQISRTSSSIRLSPARRWQGNSYTQAVRLPIGRADSAA